jgi:hypothetical protein
VRIPIHPRTRHTSISGSPPRQPSRSARHQQCRLRCCPNSECHQLRCSRLGMRSISRIIAAPGISRRSGKCGDRQLGKTVGARRPLRGSTGPTTAAGVQRCPETGTPSSKPNPPSFSRARRDCQITSDRWQAKSPKRFRGTGRRDISFPTMTEHLASRSRIACERWASETGPALAERILRTFDRVHPARVH